MKKSGMETISVFIHRHFSLCIYLAGLLLALWILHSARTVGLLGTPWPGMDQYTMLNAGLGLRHGELPVPGNYLYSPLYTLWLGLLAGVTAGNLVWMRFLQGALCALIPVLIYRTGRRIGIGRSAAELAAVLYLFCGSALLISVEFLRAAPLALLFLTFFHLVVVSWQSQRPSLWLLAGVLGGACMLGRENFIAVIPLPLLFLLLPAIRARLRWRSAALFAAGVAVTVGPILIYHYIRCGIPAIVPGNGTNVFRFFQGEAALEAPLTTGLRQILVGIPAHVYDMVSPFEIPNSLSIYAHRELIPVLKVLALPMPFLMALAWIGLGGFRRNGFVLLAGLLVAGYFASIVFCDIYYRFRIPAVPLLVLLAGAGIRSLFRFRFEHRRPALAAAVILLLGAGVFTFLTPPEPRLPESERAATVRLLVDCGRFDQAAAELARARRRHVPMPEGERFLLQSMVTAGLQADAEALSRKWLDARRSAR